jgi:hypothetical protein
VNGAMLNELKRIYQKYGYEGTHEVIKEAEKISK